MAIDNVDIRILDILQREGRITNAELAGRVGLTPGPTLARVAKLEAGGYISGYSAVVSNSLLHHLHDPAVLWQSVRQLGASGACVYIKDLRRPASAAAAEALRQLYLADAPAVLQHDYLASLHAAFTPEEVSAQLQEAGLADQPNHHVELARRRDIERVDRVDPHLRQARKRLAVEAQAPGREGVERGIAAVANRKLATRTRRRKAP